MRKKTVKELDVLRALLGVWEKTCVHPCRMGLQPFIRKDTPEVRSLVPFLTAVIIRERLVIPEGHGANLRYRWSDKAGPPTYVMARRILLLARQLSSEYAKEAYRKNRQQRKED